MGIKELAGHFHGKHHRTKSHLLRGALHPFAVGWHMVLVVFVVTVASVLCASMLVRVDILQLEVLDHAVLRWQRLLRARRQYLLQKVDIPQLVTLRELDVELDVEVTELMMAVRRHTLSFDHLDGTWKGNC